MRSTRATGGLCPQWNEISEESVAWMRKQIEAELEAAGLLPAPWLIDMLTDFNPSGKPS